MKAHRRHLTPWSATPARHQRLFPVNEREETPYSPILRRWLNRQAAQHRELLLNIHAATRVLVEQPVAAGH